MNSKMWYSYRYTKYITMTHHHAADVGMYQAEAHQEGYS